MRWWPKKRVKVPRVHFDRVGGTLAAREWRAAGKSGPLKWEASIRKGDDGVTWFVRVEGTLTGVEEQNGEAQNFYTGTEACRAALKRIIEDHNAFGDV